MTKKEWLSIIALTIMVAFISFARLGDRHAPQTSWTPQFGEYALVRFPAPVDVGALMFRMGARHDQGFHVTFSRDGTAWEHLHQVNSANVFYWTHVPLREVVQYIRIMATGHELRLQEVAFLGTNAIAWGGFDLLTPEAYALFDEQHLVPERRTFMNSTYFDEIYHPRAAYEYVHGLWVFENTHPPMGKNFIALSVRLFGMTPWAWRMPGTLFGVLMVPLLYAFARVLFKHHGWAMFAATVFAFDFMRFTQTRLATIDTYVTFFVLAMYFCMFLYVREVNRYVTDRKNYEGAFLLRSLLMLAACGAMMGLAVASKWQGVYGALGLPVLFFPALYKLYCAEPRYEKRLSRTTFMACFGFFIAVPVVIYALSYIPFALAQGQGWRGAWDNQQHMFSYHAHLVAEHGFASNWWSWPLMLRPLWLYVNRISAEINAGMSTLGNPAVWWFGVVATAGAVWAVVKRKTVGAAHTRKPLKRLDPNFVMENERYALIFILTAYGFNFLPWALISRLTFIYHYFPSVPFVVLLITWFFRRYLNRTALIVGYLTVVIGLFAFFYPVLSGWPMRVEFVHRWLTWLPGWVFM